MEKSMKRNVLKKLWSIEGQNFGRASRVSSMLKEIKGAEIMRVLLYKVWDLKNKLT